MINPFLVGQSIYLRPLDRGDAPTIVPWFNDQDVTRFLVRCEPMTLRKEEEWLDRVERDEHVLPLGIALKSDDQLIGTTSLFQINFRCRSAAFGIVIGAKENWGRGHGTEATRLIVGHGFRTLNLHRVWLHVFEYNQRGVKAYEKAGFRREGVLRQSQFSDGRYWDTIVMAVLRPEWDAASAPG
jgi:RimJ/RimL family protein N-acetyltransferase